MRKTLERTLALVQELIDAEEASAPEPRRSPDQLLTELDLSLGRSLGDRSADEGRGQLRPGRSDEEVLDLLRAVMRLTPKSSGHRFFNQLFAGREPMAGVAEMLTGLLNTSMYTYKVAGVHVLIELELVRKMTDLAGFPEGEGTTVPGGSIANLVAMILARNEALPEVRDCGLGDRRLTVYMSEHGHYSVRKNAGVLGMGRQNVRVVPVDEAGRMRSDALEAMIGSDRARGALPIAIVATSGTTVLGAFDPLAEIVRIAQEQQVWLHVDGAFGGSFLLHPELKHKLDGLSQADSFAWNPHKMMGIPLPCSFVLVRKKGLLHRHFNETADYLFQQDTADLNLGTQSILCGRRNDALKLWAAWQSLGDLGWARRIERQMALARHAVERIERDSELELFCQPESLNVCFEVPGRSSPEICRRLDEEGSAVIGYGTVSGRSLIRLVTVNPEVTRREIDRLLEDVKRTAGSLQVEPATAAESSATA